MSEKKNALVIVESPTKAKTIKRFLPPGYQVEASIGHIRDLPQTASDIPKSYKDKDWARLGIDVENGFAPLYITPKDKKKIVRDLKSKVKEVDELILATDEDREGESISWHLVQLLSPKVPVRRMVFHEITRSAIEESMRHYREIDMNLVIAQETRRILDRLFGYTLSPLIWKKIAYGLSAGRVQSPGLRLIVERERERILFKRSSYWDLLASLATEAARSGKDDGKSFDARLESVDGRRVATGKDFDGTTGDLLEGKDVVALTENAARELSKKVRSETFCVAELTEKESTTRPAAPFVTSSLQQEGNRKLNLSARETMRMAQSLYERGLITYMRTDSPALSKEAIAGARRSVEKLYGKEFLSQEARQYSAKSRGAQEAHEAIRPAGLSFLHPDETDLSGKEKSLYTLIWKRTLASQMAEAKKLSVTAKIDAGSARFTATGVRILFPGFLRVYVEGKDDPEAALDDKEVFLPKLAAGDELELRNLETQGHETKPPARYTEASLVQRLEREGIGRPSTYASIISTLFERRYIRRIGSALAPTFTGFAVIQLLENHFDELIDYGFTSDMEAALDDIAMGEKQRTQYLDEFYHGADGLAAKVAEREGKIKPDESRAVRLPQLKKVHAIRIGKYGPYVVHHERENGEELEIHASIPEELAPADIREEDILELIDVQKRGPEPLGHDPETGLPVFCLTGRYGPYVQLGEKTEENPKPKRASLPKNASPKETTLEDALKYLSLPRTLGVHPETGKEIAANLGRFGPFVVHDGDFRSLKKDDDVYTIELPRALEILAQEKKGRGRGSKLIKDLGKHPAEEKKILVYDGRYGPYIKFGTKNIRLPDEKKDPEAASALTLDEAVEIVDNVRKSS